MVGFVEHPEGSTRLLVPRASLARSPPPTTPVFFNPAASLNRDVSVAVTEATGGATFCDSMAGVGARGLRVAKEVGGIEKVVMVDFNSEALRVAKRGAALNRVARKCGFANSETTSYLFSRYSRDEKFDYVDVDPFGTPVRQLQAGLNATSNRGILSVTATDTAVLCGVYPRVSTRRYGALSLGNHFGHETGVRILFGALARLGAQAEVGVQPIFAHSTRHYIRIFARVEAGAARADEALEHVGYLAWCPHCGHTMASDVAERSCHACGKKARPAGPLWLHGLTASEVVKDAAEAAARLGLVPASNLIRSFEGLDGYPPWSFSIERASSSLGVATVSESSVHRSLDEEGWRAMRTPLEKTGVKTDATYGDFLRAVKRSATAVEKSTSGLT